MTKSGAEAARRVVEELRRAELLNCRCASPGHTHTCEARMRETVARLAPIFARAQEHARGAPRNNTDCSTHGRFVATICIGCHDALRERAERAEALCESYRRDLNVAERELERWRHGATIEGDFVCPNALARTNAEADVKRLRAALADISGRVDDALDATRPPTGEKP